MAAAAFDYNVAVYGVHFKSTIVTWLQQVFTYCSYQMSGMLSKIR